MNYSEFLLIFLFPWVVLELFLLFRRNDPIKIVLLGLSLVSGLMIIITGPFLNYLARKGFIAFDSNLSMAMIEALPLEKCVLVAAMAFFTGLLLYFFRPRIHRKSAPSRVVKFSGCLFYFVVGALGAIMLEVETTRHLGVILIWSAPFLFLEWLLGGHIIWRTKGMFFLAVGLSSFYFTLIEGFALKKDLWRAGVRDSLEISLVNVPLERAVFYVMFSLVLCQALEIFWYFYQRPQLLVGKKEKN